MQLIGSSSTDIACHTIKGIRVERHESAVKEYGETEISAFSLLECSKDRTVGNVTVGDDARLEILRNTADRQRRNTEVADVGRRTEAVAADGRYLIFGKKDVGTERLGFDSEVHDD